MSPSPADARHRLRGGRRPRRGAPGFREGHRLFVPWVRVRFCQARRLEERGWWGAAHLLAITPTPTADLVSQVPAARYARQALVRPRCPVHGLQDRQQQ